MFSKVDFLHLVKSAVLALARSDAKADHLTRASSFDQNGLVIPPPRRRFRAAFKVSLPAIFRFYV